MNRTVFAKIEYENNLQNNKESRIREKKRYWIINKNQIMRIFLERGKKKKSNKTLTIESQLICKKHPYDKFTR